MTEYYRAKTVAATFFRTPFIGTEFSNFPRLETTLEPTRSRRWAGLFSPYHLMHRVRALESETLVPLHIQKVLIAPRPKLISKSSVARILRR